MCLFVACQFVVDDDCICLLLFLLPGTLLFEFVLFDCVVVTLLLACAWLSAFVFVVYSLICSRWLCVCLLVDGSLCVSAYLFVC